ncbi:MAG: acylphosphatase [Candidatus Levybacteria bacterium CG10_big_fil_rev_8_21_14_0_10_35_13]|nr:MAG: acylphosphatase [Candidatus Levybacteria bacterium CG10_big_fil_rev_8_21_14_0_10_35_13]
MTAHIFVLGFVQGVGFRRFIQKKAQELGLTGWVRNLPDGRVEILAQGKKEDIGKLIKIAQKGTWFSDTKDVVVDFTKGEEKLESFEIRF